MAWGGIGKFYSEKSSRILTRQIFLSTGMDRKFFLTVGELSAKGLTAFDGDELPVRVGLPGFGYVEKLRRGEENGK